LFEAEKMGGAEVPGEFVRTIGRGFARSAKESVNDDPAFAIGRFRTDSRSRRGPVAAKGTGGPGAFAALDPGECFRSYEGR
jgi:hypothetical protein